MKKILLLRYLCVTYIACFLLTPTIKIPGFIGLRLDDLLTFLIVGYFFLAAKSTKINIKVPIRANLLLFFSLLMMLSITWGGTFKLPTSILDLTKYIWLLKMLVTYLLFYNFIYIESNASSRVSDITLELESNRSFILKTVVTIASISAFICFLQYANPLGINKYYIPLIAPTQYESLMSGYGTPRVVGMIGNPNAQGYLMALSLLIASFLQFKYPSKANLFKCFIIAIAMFLTLSRTSLVCFLIGFLILFLLYSKDKNFVYYKIFLLVIISSLLFVLIIFLKNNETIYNLILWRFETLSNVMEDKSFLARMHGWVINLEYIGKSPLIGVGPVPRGVEIFGAADNEWLLFARSYGVLGIFWLLMFFLLPLLVYSRSSSIPEKNYTYLLLSVIGMTFVYMVPSAVFTSSSLNCLLIILLAIKDRPLWTTSNNMV
ncbi:MAG: O-antigen ligase family protein [Alteromonadales bacterium]|nr:O-antigen ligase family protein [Alteromonadales bacterium]